MSPCRLARSRKTSAWSAVETERRPGDRSAAIATERASLGVVLVRSTGPQDPDSGGQGGGNIEDQFPGADQLLGQQIAEPTSRFDSPGAIFEGLCPRQQLVGLLFGGPNGDGGEFGFVRPDGHRGMCGLVGIDTNDDGHAYLLVRWWNREGTPGADRGACSSFEPLTART
jgi:hypothetical protein